MENGSNRKEMGSYWFQCGLKLEDNWNGRGKRKGEKGCGQWTVVEHQVKHYAGRKRWTAAKKKMIWITQLTTASPLNPRSILFTSPILKRSAFPRVCFLRNSLGKWWKTSAHFLWVFLFPAHVWLRRKRGWQPGECFLSFFFFFLLHLLRNRRAFFIYFLILGWDCHLSALFKVRRMEDFVVFLSGFVVPG